MTWRNDGWEIGSISGYGTVCQAPSGFGGQSVCPGRGDAEMHVRLREDRPYCTLIFAARITLPHYAVSSAMSFPNAAGEPDSGATPCPTSRALKLSGGIHVLCFFRQRRDARDLNQGIGLLTLLLPYIRFAHLKASAEVGALHATTREGVQIRNRRQLRDCSSGTDVFNGSVRGLEGGSNPRHRPRQTLQWLPYEFESEQR